MEEPVAVLKRITYPIHMFFSISIIATGIWLSYLCVNFRLNWTIIGLGIVLFLLGFISCMGLTCKTMKFVLKYFVFMFCWLVAILGFIMFLFVITRYSGKPAEAINHPAYREYHLDHFSLWYRRRLSDSDKWNQTVSCVTASNMCARLDETYNSSQKFFNAHLTPMQSGCCMPPQLCNFTFVSPTKWTSSKTNQTYPDCANWSNDPRELCYNCDSCKAGVLADVTKRLNTANLILLITFLLSFVVYACHCVIVCIDKDEYESD